MMRRRIALAALTFALGLAAGCSTPPPSRFYTLAATATATAAPPPSTLVIAVGPVTVPSIVDRPEFVVSTGPNEVRLDDFNRWAAPVQDGLSRAISENLVAILGTPRVVRFPHTLAEEPDYRVAVEVRTFDSTPGTSATLDAVWTVRRMKDGKTQTGRTSAREAIAESGYDALAAAHSRAAARLSQDIARATLALQSEP
jgi:uncharacterized lipoprotein YmbA